MIPSFFIAIQSISTTTLQTLIIRFVLSPLIEHQWILLRKCLSFTSLFLRILRGRFFDETSGGKIAFLHNINQFAKLNIEKFGWFVDYKRIFFLTLLSFQSTCHCGIIRLYQFHLNTFYSSNQVEI